MRRSERSGTEARRAFRQDRGDGAATDDEGQIMDDDQIFARLQLGRRTTGAIERSFDSGAQLLDLNAGAFEEADQRVVGNTGSGHQSLIIQGAS